MAASIDNPDPKPLKGPDYVAIALLFALLGAFFWAIRGTGGYGGSQGGTLAGLGWAMLWFGFSRFAGGARQRPYGSGHMVAAIAVGIAFGGLTGYGVYTAWIRGSFYLDYPDGERAIGAWTGYVMMFFCGLHWGGIPGAFMAWVGPGRASTRFLWIGRWTAGIGAAVFAGWIVREFPGAFLPFYDEGIYTDANPTPDRAQGSIENIAPHVGMFLGFLLFELARRDWRDADDVAGFRPPVLGRRRMAYNARQRIAVAVVEVLGNVHRLRRWTGVRSGVLLV